MRTALPIVGDDLLRGESEDDLNVMIGRFVEVQREGV